MRESLGGCCKVFLLFLRGNSIFKVGETLACLGLFSCLTGEKTEDLGVWMAYPLSPSSGHTV